MKETNDLSPPTLTTETANALGAHGAGSVRVPGCRVDRGALRSVFRLTEAPPASYPDALAVAFRSPRAIVWCLSAAAVDEPTDEVPRVWASG